MIYRKYFYLMLPLKKFLDCEGRTYCSRRASSLKPQPSTSIEFEETGVVMDETPASETIVSVI